MVTQNSKKKWRLAIMLLINDSTTDNCRTLCYSDFIFHDTYKWVLRGEYRFHVLIDGNPAYDLVYKENNSFFTENNTTTMKFDSAVLPPYFTYDENDTNNLYLDIFEEYDSVYFETINEYTVVLARIILRETPKEVLFNDYRIYNFVEENKRLKIISNDTDIKKRGTFICCKKPYVNGGVADPDESVMSSEVLFHNVFIWQWMADKDISKIKYAFVSVLKTEGIGAILDHFTRMKNLFAKKDIRTYLMPACTRYNDEMLNKYFHFEKPPKDATDKNTIYLYNFLPLRASHLFYKSDAKVRMDMLNQDFLKDINEYYETLFGSKKMLGVLIRGTDYVNLKLDGIRRQATVEELAPIIDKWIEDDGYEQIFLATEDKDVLDKMVARYGKKLVTVSQERHSVSEFKEGEYLSDIEKKRDKASYDASIEDTTSNYFYALVILSKCTSFIASGQCNGWDVVNSFNNDSFYKKYRFSPEDV